VSEALDLAETTAAPKAAEHLLTFTLSGPPGRSQVGMRAAPGRATTRWLPLRFCVAALLIAACSMDLGSANKSNDEAAFDTVWSASGKCARRGRQIRCGGPTEIVLASYPTTAMVDAARPQVWSNLTKQFSQGRFKIEQTDETQAKLVVKYTGTARPYIECAGSRTVAGKTEMGKPDTSPGNLETRLLIRLEEARNNKTRIHLATRHVLKHKDEAIKDSIVIEDRSVSPLGDGRVCWSTGTLERSALAPGQDSSAQPQAPAGSQPPAQGGSPDCVWNPKYYRYVC
jgi:hypothetical protein